jgi:hypothetical protein
MNQKKSLPGRLLAWKGARRLVLFSVEDRNMKRYTAGLVATLMLALLLAVSARPAAAVPDEYDDSQSNPLRVAAYLAYPVGFTLEWLIFRPFHYIVSRPYLDQFFGHHPHSENQVY